MELKLNVYKNRQIEKTYVTEDFRLTTGTCEDVLNAIQIDKLGAIDLDKIGDAPPMEFLIMFTSVQKQFRPIMKEVFEGLTDDEYRRTYMEDVAGIAWHIIMYTLTNLFNASGN